MEHILLSPLSRICLNHEVAGFHVKITMRECVRYEGLISSRVPIILKKETFPFSHKNRDIL
jgi:hypothetical protein